MYAKGGGDGNGGEVRCVNTISRHSRLALDVLEF